MEAIRIDRRKRPAFRITGALLVATVFGAGCGASGRADGNGIPADTAGALATRAEHVATALETGACDQARDEAQALQSDIAVLNIDPGVEAEAAARAGGLLAAIDCPPPTTTTTGVAGEPRPGKEKKHKGGHDHDD